MECFVPDCSGSGDCVNGSCICHSGYSGRHEFHNLDGRECSANLTFRYYLFRIAFVTNMASVLFAAFKVHMLWKENEKRQAPISFCASVCIADLGACVAAYFLASGQYPADNIIIPVAMCMNGMAMGSESALQMWLWIGCSESNLKTLNETKKLMKTWLYRLGGTVSFSVGVSAFLAGVYSDSTTNVFLTLYAFSFGLFVLGMGIFTSFFGRKVVKILDESIEFMKETAGDDKDKIVKMAALRLGLVSNQGFQEVMSYVVGLGILSISLTEYAKYFGSTCWCALALKGFGNLMDLGVIKTGSKKKKKVLPQRLQQATAVSEEDAGLDE